MPPGEKAVARDMAREWVPALHGEGKRVMVRVNSLDTGLTRADKLYILIFAAILLAGLLTASILAEKTWKHMVRNSQVYFRG